MIEIEFREAMEASPKVRDRLSENSDENSYINQIPISLYPGYPAMVA